MRQAPNKKDERRTADVRGLRAMILGVKNNTTPTVKKSVSIPASLYVWACKRAKQQGHDNVSRVVREGIECLMAKQRA